MTTPNAHGVNLPTQSLPYPQAFRILEGHDTEQDGYLPAKATAIQELESMRLCPKFDSCSATICPLDPNWRLRDMTSRDAACTWLLEMARGGPTATCVPVQIRSQVAEVLPAILSSVRMGNLRSAMNRAAKSSSRRDPARLARLDRQEAA